MDLQSTWCLRIHCSRTDVWNFISLFWTESSQAGQFQSGCHGHHFSFMKACYICYSKMKHHSTPLKLPIFKSLQIHSPQLLLTPSLMQRSCPLVGFFSIFDCNGLNPAVKGLTQLSSAYFWSNRLSVPFKSRV